MPIEVANADAANGAEATPGGAQYRMDKWAMLKTFVFRLIFTYFIFTLFRRNPAPATPGKPGVSAQSSNILMKDESLDMFVYLTETPQMTNYSDQSLLFWHLEGLRYGNWEDGEARDGSYTKTAILKASENLKNNGSMYIHVYFVLPGFSPDPESEEKYSKQYTFSASKEITRMRKRRLSRTMNLLTGHTEAHSDLIASKDTPVDVKYLPPISHWHPNLTVNLIDDHTPWVRESVPAPINEYIKWYEPTNQYYPAVYINDFWNLNEEYMPVNKTTPELTFRLTVAPMSLFKWQLYLSQSMRKSWFPDLLGQTEDDKFNEDEDQDTMKKTFLETNPYLLTLTVVVSVIHSIFEMLAFKNDIQFWRSRESFEGLSLRSVLFNIVQSVIVVLYVLDNDTNFVVRISVCIGLAIEIWKIHKVFKIRFDQNRKLFFILPRPSFEWQSSYVESETKAYDQMAFKYLSWVLFPLLIAYAGYSLVYEEHRGWYSWVLSMLYGFFLTFSFIAMTPQLFINYKLKSVAHLPWRMLTYKALNTFIDDLFAFVIKTPTLYRIGCFRDDVIFFIYLYQRWIYRIDPKRVNEFGVSKEMLDDRKEEGKEAEVTTTEEEGVAKDEQMLNFTNAKGADNAPETSNSSVRRRRGKAIKSTASLTQELFSSTFSPVLL
ncbi:Cleft lip and palate transmembrane protein 1 -like protein [Echinococcus granulosus]|uniref:Cleft lip and palate transmembrane protein 1 n=1 Tax=Echinococcus granulosus TaxID=6210 RepID=A0A068WNT2_ECHGR|nr:Cleft lip and palate transmembrane protein 1 -like protein [Echinococcus granulosus]CDS19272.1 Cleft lip and palate transmembrane protein 1 [Echinococcus granulosus]